MDQAALSFKKVRQALYTVSGEYSTELKKELVNLNLTRLQVISVALILLTLITVMVDLTLYRVYWSINTGYINLFYAHIFLLAERTLYISFVYFIKVKNLHYLYKLKSKCAADTRTNLCFYHL